MLTYLRANEPHEIVGRGPHEFRTASHGSLVISKGKWIWNREKIGGRSALDYLVKIREMGFVEAVQTVCNSCGTPSIFVPKIDTQTKNLEFFPPKKIQYSNKAISYLQQRGISPEIINRCIQAGIFYESRYYNPESEYHNAAVCVFAGKDDKGKIKFATMRGINTDFKRDKAGSDKRYNFCLPSQNTKSKHLAVFESPIDLLSHATLQQKNGWQWDGFRLSLGGTSDVALLSFLKRNPQICRVMLHLDNDKAGLVSAHKIKTEIKKRFPRIRISINPPRGGKDYNEVLLRIVKLEKGSIQKRQSKTEVLI